MLKIKKYTILVAVGLLALRLSSCTNDKKEIEAPVANCDTTNITYSQTIKPLIQTRCFGAGSSCHGPGSPNQSFNTYEKLTDEFYITKISASIRHEQGALPMPQGQDKLPECEINTIVTWINKGYPNN